MNLLLRELVQTTRVHCTSRTFSRQATEMPLFVISDDGKIFKAEELRGLVAANKMKWQFIVEKFTCWGGFYERMVRRI